MRELTQSATNCRHRSAEGVDVHTSSVSNPSSGEGLLQSSTSDGYCSCNYGLCRTSIGDRLNRSVGIEFGCCLPDLGWKVEFLPQSFENSEGDDDLFLGAVLKSDIASSVDGFLDEH